MSVGIPIKLLHESLGHVIECELLNGSVYRGKLVECEDSMNVQLSHVVSITLNATRSNQNHSNNNNTEKQSNDGNTADGTGGLKTADNVFIRGSQIRSIIVPDMLRHAPMFTRSSMGPSGLSRGKGLGLAKEDREVAFRQRLNIINHTTTTKQ